jgi:hypothetical protein
MPSCTPVTPTYPGWYSRLQDERIELLDKIAKLTAYKKKDALLVAQLHCMIAYCAILDIRLMNYIKVEKDTHD